MAGMYEGSLTGRGKLVGVVGQLLLLGDLVPFGVLAGEPGGDILNTLPFPRECCMRTRESSSSSSSSSSS